MKDPKWRSNCYICGRFVGKDGNHDIYDNEQGYPTCGKHTKKWVGDSE